MKSVIQEKTGKYCSKRVTSVACLVASIVFALLQFDTEIVVSFLSASFASNGLTIWDHKNN